ncbi:YlxR family protein [Salinibacterium sp. SYSU T00001]|uniref:YlxR family protein n=1 Tax=Homoserinimonas sedimenticola TaxID=2986805 RepID=UPI0022364B37|nr:YlxR family protein [Salinibacterium sedimenticola]MCW4386709.1 YlxR family protein [Salinibacterium sedimenticola]
MGPVRTCLGCRRRAPASSLVRCVARDGAVVADASATLPGRGAWVHPSEECVEKSIKRRAFGRALRVSSALDTSGVLQAVLASHQSEPPHGAP